MKLHLEVEAVDVGMPRRAVPVRRAVLMPADRCAQTGFLHENRVVVGHEVIAVDRRSNGQQAGVPVEAKGLRHQHAHAEDQVNDVLRGVGGGGGLCHLRRMAAGKQRGAAPRIRQWLRQHERLNGVVSADRWPPLHVEFGFGSSRGSVDHIVDGSAQLADLTRSDHVLKHVKAVRAIGAQDLWRQTAVGIEVEWTSSTEASGRLLSLDRVFTHCVGMGGA